MAQEKDHVAGLAIQIPESLIRQTIMAEVAKAIPSDQIVARVVQLAMAEKRNSYDKETIFENTIKEEIRKLCKEVFADWLKEQKDKIRAHLLRELERNNAKQVKDVATKMADGLANLYVHQIHLGVRGFQD